MITKRLTRNLLGGLCALLSVAAICTWPVARKQKPRSITQATTVQADRIVVNKKERLLMLYAGKKCLKKYKIALGFCPVGHKEREGDGKTPEGAYVIAHKNPKSQFYLSLKISYPSWKDRKKAAQKGIDPGGDIMIHGLGPRFAGLGAAHIQRDWTLGSIAVTDDEIGEIYASVPVGTPVNIQA